MHFGYCLLHSVFFPEVCTKIHS